MLRGEKIHPFQLSVDEGSSVVVRKDRPLITCAQCPISIRAGVCARVTRDDGGVPVHRTSKHERGREYLPFTAANGGLRSPSGHADSAERPVFD